MLTSLPFPRFSLAKFFGFFLMFSRILGASYSTIISLIVIPHSSDRRSIINILIFVLFDFVTIVISLGYILVHSRVVKPLIHVRRVVIITRHVIDRMHVRISPVHIAITITVVTVIMSWVRFSHEIWMICLVIVVGVHLRRVVVTVTSVTVSVHVI